MKIAIVQIDAELGDVISNIEKVKRYVIKAKENDAELIVLPEFFSSAIGFSEKLLDVALMGDYVSECINRLSRENNIIIAGSYLKFDMKNTYNQFEMVFPNGQVFIHKKDIPTQFENCYYTYGDKENVLHTPIGDIGVALCWELIRYNTLKRMSQKVDLVIAGSCWWDLPIRQNDNRLELRKYNQELAINTPLTFARLVHAPLVHASHCGKTVTYNFPFQTELQERRFVGAAQAIDKDGNIIKRRLFSQGEGIEYVDMVLGNGIRKQADIVPERYWIPKLEPSYINAWKTLNPIARKYYDETALPYYQAKGVK